MAQARISLYTSFEARFWLLFSETENLASFCMRRGRMSVFILQAEILDLLNRGFN